MEQMCGFIQKFKMLGLESGTHWTPVEMAGTGTAPGKAFFHSNFIFGNPISYHFILI